LCPGSGEDRELYIDGKGMSEFVRDVIIQQIPHLSRQVTLMATEDRQTERELILGFKTGDENALRTLFERYQNDLQARVERLMSRALQRRVSVADVLQEARITAFERRTDFEDRGAGSFRNWLLGIVEMKARRMVRRHTEASMRSIDREVTRDYRPDTDACAGNEPSPSQAAVGSEMEDLAYQAIEALPDNYREVFRLTCIEHLSLDEAAERMGRSSEAVRKLQGRAILKFTEIFNRMRGEGDG
jgi:RNA polymerase sigma-70 factor (ECF subfamily)